MKPVSGPFLLLTLRFAPSYRLSRRMLKKARLLTRPTLAATSPSHPASAKTVALPSDAPCLSKAAASYSFSRGGLDNPNCSQYSTHQALSAPRLALSRARAFSLPISPSKAVTKGALNCAHRTSTVSPCAFCEQGDRPSHPALFSAS